MSILDDTIYQESGLTGLMSRMLVFTSIETLGIICKEQVEMHICLDRINYSRVCGSRATGTKPTVPRLAARGMGGVIRGFPLE